MKISRKFLSSHPWVGFTLGLCTAILLYLFVSNLGYILRGLQTIGGFFYPVFLGIIMAYVIDPLVKLFQRLFQKLHVQKYNRTISVVVSLSVLIVFLIILLVALIPQLIDSITNLVGNANSYLSTLQTLLGTAANSLSNSSVGDSVDISGIMESVQSFATDAVGFLTSNADQILNTSINIGTNIADWILSFILAIYFLMDKKRLLHAGDRFLRAVLTVNAYEPLHIFLSRCNAILVRFIAFELVDALIVGFANYFVMLITGMPYPSLISVVVGVTNLAPTFGPVLGGAIGAFILVLTNPWAALGFLILTLVLQIIDGYIIKPKLFGNQLGVPSILILISIIVGGRMMGIPGILLAIPFAAILTFLYSDYLLPRLEKSKPAEHAVKEMHQIKNEMTDEE